MLKTIAAIISTLCLLLAGTAGSAAEPERFSFTSTVMGTALEVVLKAGSEEEAKKAFEAVEAEMRRVESVMSEWQDGSPVSEVNREAGVRPVKVPSELFNVISGAVTVARLTGGAFDPTWAALRGLWVFTPGLENVPSEEEIAARLGLVGYLHVELDSARETVFLRKKGAALGLGGIAKGYAVDRAMQEISSLGIRDAIVKAGGDIRVQGSEGDGGWEIGVQDPRARERIMARLTLTDISISTSGDYERYFVKDGRRYHHIIDPRKGYPAEGVMSATVIGPDTMTTDALATAVFVLGPENGIDLAERLPGIEAVVVDSSGVVHSTSGIDLGE